MRDDYAAPFGQLDFHRDPENARVAINQWVNAQTRSKIRNLIPPRGVNANTRLVLVNAFYLKAPWDIPFEESITLPQPFHLQSGATHDVPMMRRIAYLGYTHEYGFTVVALEYLGDELQCLILLPDEDQSLDTADLKLTPADFSRWAQIGKQARPFRVALSIPKFRIEGTTLQLRFHTPTTGN